MPSGIACIVEDKLSFMFCFLPSGELKNVYKYRTITNDINIETIIVDAVYT